jgi:opacity protein-like surface antigen
MSRSSHPFRRSFLIVIAVVFACALPRPATAQAYISPFIGYNFSGDAGCPHITQCEDKNLDWGASLGAANVLFGFELDTGYTRHFFGESNTYDVSVLTFMGNVLLAPRFGPIQPYGLVGLGLIRTTNDLSSIGGIDESSNDFGSDVGGGLMIHFSRHVGIRGDVRYFYTFDALSILGIRDDEQKLDFGRVSGAMVFRF